MSQFIIQRALAPAQGDIAQLFMVFAEPEQGRQCMDDLIASIAKTFPTAALVLVQPREQAESEHLTQKILNRELLSDSELNTYTESTQAELQELIQTQQKRFNVLPEATAIVAVGQMASALLELSKLAQPLAGRMFIFGGRFAQLPTEKLSLEQTVHFFHGGKDPDISIEHTMQAQTIFAELEGDATIDVGHAMEESFNAELIQKMIERVLTCVPLRYWLQAQGMKLDTECSPGPDDSVH